MVDAAGTTRYTYTVGGQMLTEGGLFASDTVTNTYVNRLRVALGLAQPAGAWTNGFIYDSAGRLTNVTSKAGTFSYLLAGNGNQVSRILLPNSSYITNTFDPVARLMATYLKKSDHTILDDALYGYNLAGQRTAFTNAAGTYYQYAYDPLGQLLVADSSTASEDRGYYYDAAWNLNRLTNNGTVSTFTVNSKNQLTAAPSPMGSLTYDGLGNLTANSNYRTYYYDDENRLTGIWQYDSWTNAVWRTDFVYDGLGRLRKRLEWIGGYNDRPMGLEGLIQPLVGGGTNWNPWAEVHYIYDGKRVIQERDYSDTPYVAYTRGSDLSGTLEGAGGIGGMLARSYGYASGNWSTHTFYHADGDGNITYLETSAQGLAASYRYDPFGNTVSSSGTLADANAYRFSSKECHTNSGMYYYLYRFYDPSLQRWISRDPLGDEAFLSIYSRGKPANERRSLSEQSTDPQQYEFAQNQSPGAIDPNGLTLRLPVNVPNSGELAVAMKHYNDACKQDDTPTDADCHTICDAFYGNVQDWLVAVCMTKCEDCQLGNWCKKNPPLFRFTIFWEELTVIIEELEGRCCTVIGDDVWPDGQRRPVAEVGGQRQGRGRSVRSGRGWQGLSEG